MSVTTEQSLHVKLKCNLCKDLATHFHHHLDKTTMKVETVSFCASCHFSIVSVYAQARKEKMQQVAQTFKDQGKKVWGRPRSADYEKIIELRKAGLSMREIADKLEVTKGTVQRAIELALR